MTTNLHDKMLAAIDAYFSASNEIEAHIAEEQLLDVRAEINKYKLAAESLSEGLRLDDWDKIGCVNHDCGKCKALAEQPAQQEPVAIHQFRKCGCSYWYDGVPDHHDGQGPYEVRTLYTTPQAQPAQSTADKSELETVPAKGGLLPAQQNAERGEPVATLYGTLPVYDKPAQQDLPDLIAGALGVSRGTAYDMMREALAEQSVQQTCNCRWEGEVQVQQCTLHEAHIDAIHEWAGRAKAAEAKLAEQPAQQEPVAHINSNGVVHATGYPWGDKEVLRPLVYGDTTPQPPAPAQPLTDDKYEAIVEDLAEWNRYVEVDTAHQSLEKHVREVLTAHGIMKGNT